MYRIAAQYGRWLNKERIQDDQMNYRFSQRFHGRFTYSSYIIYCLLRITLCAYILGAGRLDRHKT